jgi:hypothetical protein
MSWDVADYTAAAALIAILVVGIAFFLKRRWSAPVRIGCAALVVVAVAAVWAELAVGIV